MCQGFLWELLGEPIDTPLMHLQTREELLSRARDLFEGVRGGWLKIRIDHVSPLEPAADAHRLLEGRKTVGKMILKTAD